MKRAAGLLVLTFALFPVSAGATIRYQVSLAHRESHWVDVTMSFPAGADTLKVALPAWNALYQIRDFSSRLRDLRATDDRSPKPLPVTKLDKQTWQVTSTGGASSTVRIDYSAYWDDPGPFSSQLGARHAFFNLADFLLYIPGRTNEDVSVAYTDLPAGWHVAEELSGGPAAFQAPGYNALVDAPAELGTFEESRIQVGSASIRLVVDAASWNRKDLEEIVRRVVGYETSLMGEAPFTEYTFFYHFGSSAVAGSGGMEHANCTAIAAESPLAAANTTAHEFFHLWNVKRIRPQSLEPVDYAREQWTRALWFAEGVTSTYASYALVRSGLWSQRDFYADLANQIGELESRPAHAWKSVEEASLDAWLEKYLVYQGPELSISYYDKGQILGVLLDILIRDATQNRASLDDVLRRMNADFARRGRFYDDSAGVQAEIEHVSGTSFAEFFRRYVSGIDPLPYAAILAKAGWELRSKTHDGVSKFEIGELPDAPPQAVRIREGLLRGTVDGSTPGRPE